MNARARHLDVFCIFPFPFFCRKSSRQDLVIANRQPVRNRGTTWNVPWFSVTRLSSFFTLRSGAPGNEPNPKAKLETTQLRPGLTGGLGPWLPGAGTGCHRALPTIIFLYFRECWSNSPPHLWPGKGDCPKSFLVSNNSGNEVLEMIHELHPIPPKRCQDTSVQSHDSASQLCFSPRKPFLFRKCAQILKVSPNKKTVCKNNFSN